MSISRTIAARKFLADESKDEARKAHVRKVTGLAHPHDKVGDDEIESDFDSWVAAQGRDVFV